MSEIKVEQLRAAAQALLDALDEMPEATFTDRAREADWMLRVLLARWSA